MVRLSPATMIAACSASAVKRVLIFDFDGTLAATPTPAIGIPAYERVTGRRWPHRGGGWWSKPESLQPPLDRMIGDGPAIEDWFRVQRERAVAPPALVCMMTGRIVPLAPLVERWLQARGVSPDRCYYHSGGGSTLDVKLRHIRRILRECSRATALELWEDRPEHADAFELLHRNEAILGRHDVAVRVHRVGPAAAAAGAPAPVAEATAAAPERLAETDAASAAIRAHSDGVGTASQPPAAAPRAAEPGEQDEDRGARVEPVAVPGAQGPAQAGCDDSPQCDDGASTLPGSELSGLKRKRHA